MVPYLLFDTASQVVIGNQRDEFFGFLLVNTLSDAIQSSSGSGVVVKLHWNMQVKLTLNEGITLFIKNYWPSIGSGVVVKLQCKMQSHWTPKFGCT